MSRLAIGLLVAALMLLPVPGRAQPTGTIAAPENTILGFSYETAALATAATIAGAVALNTIVAPNAGTAIVALYAAYWVVSSAVIYAAGSWLGWWDDEVPVQAALLKD